MNAVQASCIAQTRSVVMPVVVYMGTKPMGLTVLISMNVSIKAFVQRMRFVSTPEEAIIVSVMLVFKVIFVKTSMSALPKQTTVIAMPHVRTCLVITHAAATRDTTAMVDVVWRVTVMTCYARKL